MDESSPELRDRSSPDFKANKQLALVPCFRLSSNRMVNIGIVGVGLVGSELLAQLKATGAKRLKVVGLTNSRRMVVSDANYTALSLENWQKDLENSNVQADLTMFAKYLAASPEHAVIVDCTASDAVAQLYPSWLSAGVSVVTPNKKGFSGPLSLYKEIASLAANLSQGHDKKVPLAYHESTVGAGLPVLATLSDLVKTGDEIEKIEGIFSGTLSYLFNNFSTLSSAGTSQSFSSIVKVAKELGYTEPDPRDDLNGMDVARKVNEYAKNEEKWNRERWY